MRIPHLLATAAVVALAACGDYGAPDEVVYGVAVYTQKTEGANFTNYGTYALDPEVTVRKDGQAEASGDLNTPAYAQVRAAIVRQMELAGYGPAPVDSTPAPGKVGLKLAIATNSVNYYYSGGWCDIYYGWYGCYYPPVYAGSYSYGTAILGMVDLGAPPAVGQEFPSLWFSAVYGVVDSGPGSSNYNTSRLVEGINRAFDQSPYLSAP